MSIIKSALSAVKLAFLALFGVSNATPTATIFKAIQGAAAAVGVGIVTYLGGADAMLYTLVAFTATDYVLGWMIAIINWKLSSKIGFKGICKKGLMFGWVGLGQFLDNSLSDVLGGLPIIRTLLILFFIGNEGISLIENSAVLGLPIPQKIKDILIQLKEGKLEILKNKDVKKE